MIDAIARVDICQNKSFIWFGGKDYCEIQTAWVFAFVYQNTLYNALPFQSWSSTYNSLSTHENKIKLCLPIAFDFIRFDYFLEWAWECSCAPSVGLCGGLAPTLSDCSGGGCIERGLPQDECLKGSSLKSQCRPRLEEEPSFLPFPSSTCVANQTALRTPPIFNRALWCVLNASL